MHKDNPDHIALAHAICENLEAAGAVVDVTQLKQAVVAAARARRVTYGAAGASERVLGLMKGDDAVRIQMPPAAHPQGAPCEFFITPEMVERIRGHYDTSILRMPVPARWPESARVRDTVLSSDLEGFFLTGTGPTRHDSLETARLSITGLIGALIRREPTQGIKFSHPAG
ncbi:hypothetical protein [Paraburkholderia sp. A3RO-2L]|jgi:hypothetical protein|uniref:hypothetical protein n=1 Tax=unclassified Paraburkholderia TaxID=2615204 RepID=UPI003DA8297A